MKYYVMERRDAAWIDILNIYKLSFVFCTKLFIPQSTKILLWTCFWFSILPSRKSCQSPILNPQSSIVKPIIKRQSPKTSISENFRTDQHPDKLFFHFFCTKSIFKYSYIIFTLNFLIIYSTKQKNKKYKQNKK